MRSLMSRFSRALLRQLGACVVCAGAAWFVSGAAAQGQAVPVLSGLGVGWLEIGDDLLPPPSGPGPVISDPAHPYHSNISGLPPTFRVADLTNPILQPWVVERLRKANDL